MNHLFAFMQSAILYGPCFDQSLLAQLVRCLLIRPVVSDISSQEAVKAAADCGTLSAAKPALIRGI